MLEIPLLGLLPADGSEVRIGLGPGQQVGHRLNIGKLRLARGNLLPEFLLGRIPLAVLVIVLLYILIGGQTGIELDLHIGVPLLIVILHHSPAVALLDGVHIGRQQIAVDLVLLPVGALLQLPVLIVQTAGNTLLSGSQQLLQIQ